ncbi:amidohydrolase family protein [Salinicoccus hispanicus]|uniref:Amidohydrolase family protein n=1 Tax=Salinicoccus hispanicus TaxID=157225 RepID=A0A6N8U0U8_9STAP|nr:amidohydrolase family protein [Salinicoccus hispanicus]MXQ51392.1 amidohydrolase family protein [Salinicoccus hispanicus]
MHYIIRNVDIFDEGVLRTANVEIKDRQIVSTDSDRQTVNDIDGTGKFLLPGLVDMHTHITPQSAKHYLASGVTTVRNTAGNYEMIEEMDEVSPEVHATYRMIDGDPGLWGPTSYGNISTNNTAEAKGGVDELHDQGAEFVKVYGNITEDVLAAVVEQAQGHGLPVAADFIHSKHIDGVKAAEMGVDWLEHASGILQSLYPGFHSQLSDEAFDAVATEPLDENRLVEVLDTLLDADVKLVPTLTLYRHLAEGKQFGDSAIAASRQLSQLESDEDFGIDAQFERIAPHVSEEMQRREKWAYKKISYIAKRYMDLGGEVYIGTDAPAGIWNYPGISLIEEMMEFEALGLTRSAVIKKATEEACLSMGYENKGRVAGGYGADLILLEENPLDDLTHLLSIDSVIRAGVLHSVEDLYSHRVDVSALEQLFESITAKYGG